MVHAEPAYRPAVLSRPNHGGQRLAAAGRPSDGKGRARGEGPLRGVLGAWGGVRPPHRYLPTFDRLGPCGVPHWMVRLCQSGPAVQSPSVTQQETVAHEGLPGNYKYASDALERGASESPKLGQLL